MIYISLNNEYLLKSDSLNYILCKKVKKKNDDANSDEYSVVGYYNSIESAAKRIVETELRESDCKTLEELLKFVRALNQNIITAIQRTDKQKGDE